MANNSLLLFGDFDLTFVSWIERQFDHLAMPATSLIRNSSTVTHTTVEAGI